MLLMAPATGDIAPAGTRIGDDGLDGLKHATPKRVAVRGVLPTQGPVRLADDVHPAEIAIRRASQHHARTAARHIDVLKLQVLPPNGENIAAAGENGSAGRGIGAALEHDGIAGRPDDRVADHGRRIAAGIDVDDVSGDEIGRTDQIGQGQFGLVVRRSRIGVVADLRGVDVLQGGSVIDVVGCRSCRTAHAQQKAQADAHHPNSRFHL